MSVDSEAPLSAIEAIPARRQGSQYTREQIASVAVHYVVTGSARRVAELTGIPERTIADWIRAEWWHGLVTVIRRDKADELDSMLTGLVHRAVETAADRIEHGDYRIRNDGELVRVPVSAKDATMVAAIAYDKRQIGRALPTQITMSANGRLRALQDQLAQISGRTIDGETVADALPSATQSATIEGKAST